ncbi:MAG: Flp1 family type IVb pilin [Pseudobdellovibrionaceae bacterium]
MKKLKNFAKTLWQDESGQGTAEYVLLIAIVVGLVIMFKDKIKGLVSGKLGEIDSGFGQISTQ